MFSVIDSLLKAWVRILPARVMTCRRSRHAATSAEPVSAFPGRTPARSHKRRLPGSLLAGRFSTACQPRMTAKLLPKVVTVA
ncbi:hypothetical protein [Stutzerimonas stutzeri]|uniref:hypothetical protein n=1 Tax=Stutzerimonas stutzeri TaxID=316 RepID=UPI00210E3EFD|nr:hypothetical protein [Stutzerimonas stutzeri]MCQ4321245.1 hypothetical protein [Stutzerimonas stutzeri]